MNRKQQVCGAAVTSRDQLCCTLPRFLHQWCPQRERSSTRTEASAALVVCDVCSLGPG